MIIRARHVVPVIGPVVEDGAVRFAAGLIQEVGWASAIGGRADVDFGDAVILPGFVNAHTHLELGALAGCVPPGPSLADWLGRLVNDPAFIPRRTRIESAVRTGAARSLAAGVTSLGDITRFPAWTRPVLAESGLTAVSFGEVIAIGTRRHLLAERLDAAAAPVQPASRVCVGISPHAPYSVEPAGLRACASRAEQLNVRLCMHLAESPEEEVFTRTGGGPLADHLRRLGVWDESVPVAGCGPVELAARTGILSPRTVLAHANYASDEDIALIARSGASVAYCPRTHAAFGHPPHRFREMLAGGVNVGIGTDSLASNPDPSVLGELRFLRLRRADVDSATLVAMGTLAGARALGFGDSIGALTPQRRADLVVIRLSGRADRWDAILEAEEPPTAVYLGGVRCAP